MNNIAMRSFVVVLALVGFGATTVTSSAKTTSTSATTAGVQVQTSVVAHQRLLLDTAVGIMQIHNRLNHNFL